LFSRRLHWNLAANALSRVAASRADLLDLTVSNPTRAGFAYPGAWREALADPRAFAYEPAAQGLLVTREAVAAYYADHGAPVDPADVFLTASTSEAYAYLFKLLTDPGDEVLIPQPSYPLFEFLATLEQTATHPYPVAARDVTPWRSTRSRALVAVHPNNPTGECFAEALAASCGEQGLPVIVDEVFLDYGWGAPVPTFAGRHEATSFILSGLSKICALPQMKLGWMVVNGPRRTEIRERLELIADTYLSASTPVQWAAVKWLADREALQGPVRARVAANLAALDASGLARRAGAGGWSAVVELPEGVDEEQAALALAVEDGVLVQPGYFYDFAGAPVVVVSLLTEIPVFAEGVGRIGRRFR